VVDDETAVRLDGRCARATHEALHVDGGYSAAALNKTTVQVTTLVRETVAAYAREFGPSEVGAHGSGTATDSVGSTGQAPTGLLYGRVQSGKTLAMTVFTALALDNGFRIVIVLTSNFLKLVKQTAERFETIQGALILPSTRIETWNEDAAHYRRQVGPNGLVIICAKDPKHLATLVEFLKAIDAARYPSLILDDEADQATPDTTMATRSRGAYPVSSTVHRRVVRNDVEPEQSVREAVPHNVFVQVTATPYALLLQNIDHPLRPSFSCLLEAGDGYTGGEAFFGDDKLEGPKPPIVYVDETESQRILASDVEAPLGLERAITFFLLSAATQHLRDRPRGGQNFLCHTSLKTQEHKRVGGIIRNYLANIDEELDKVVEGTCETAIRFVEAYVELKKTIIDAPALPLLIENLQLRLPRRSILEINSTTDVDEYPRSINFLVGGNILGRGLTIDNLLVTYYLRAAKTTQMDTVLQHARMFGYRQTIMPYTRVFSPESLIERFAGIHAAEQALRGVLRVMDPHNPLPVITPMGLRATRANVLDTRTVAAIMPGDRVGPTAPSPANKTTRALNGRITTLLSELERLEGNDNYPLRCAFSDLVSIVEMLPYEEGDGWPKASIVSVLHSIESRYGASGWIYRRNAQRRDNFNEGKGALRGPDRARIKLKTQGSAPVLTLLFDDSNLVGYPYWQPSFIFPDNMSAHIFNISET